MRVKSLLEQQKQSKSLLEQIDEDTNISATSEESKYRISFNEKFLKQKKREEQAKEKNREKIQQDRAIRAQRRLEAKKN